MTNSTTTNHKEALVTETDIPATPKDACIFLSDYAAWLLGCGATCIRIEKNVKRMADRWNMTSEMTILPSHIHMTVWNDDRSHSYSNIVRLHQYPTEQIKLGDSRPENRFHRGPPEF